MKLSLTSLRCFLSLPLTIGLVLSVAGNVWAEPLRVVATFSIIADFARQVGGDRVEVTTLIGPDGDAHAYEPSAADVRAVSTADLILVNGLGFEGFLDRLVRTSGADARIAVLSDGVTPRTARDGAIDPHAFQTIPNARIYAENVADGLCAVDPDGCESYRANEAAYARRLNALEQEVRADLDAIPPERRVVITSHDAFGYFAEAYGITFLAAEGVSTDAEPSAAAIASLIDQVRAQKAAALFLESMTDPRLVRQIASETGVAIGGTLYPDSLSPPGGPAPTYIDLMRHNVSVLRQALAGE
jgi:zinc/manganese transport system substrate-binding protein